MSPHFTFLRHTLRRLRRILSPSLTPLFRLKSAYDAIAALLDHIKDEHIDGDFPDLF